MPFTTVTCTAEETIIGEGTPRGDKCALLLTAHTPEHYDRTVAVFVELTRERAVELGERWGKVRSLGDDVHAAIFYDLTPIWFQAYVAEDPEIGALLDECRDHPVLLQGGQVEKIAKLAEDDEISTDGDVVKVHASQAGQEYDRLWWGCKDKYTEDRLSSAALSPEQVAAIAFAPR